MNFVLFDIQKDRNCCNGMSCSLCFIRLAILKRIKLYKKSLYNVLMKLSLCFSGTTVKPDENGVCISKGGRFSPYESEGKPPKSADREFKDLNMCKVFHGKTCCSASQMHSASLAVKNLATFGESVKDCLDLFELLECSICNPNVGVQTGLPRICASFCDRVFEACSDAYFSSNATSKVRPVFVNS